MTLYAQHGYGKADKLNVLADGGDIAGVILSPADEGLAALRGTVRAMARRNVETLLDPQTYVYTIPNAVGRSHEELGLEFGTVYWATVTPSDIEAHVEAVIRANEAVGTTGSVIAPSPRQGSFGDLWLPLALQYARTTATRATGRSVLASVVVEEGGLTEWNAIERWLDIATTLDIEGFYIVIGRRSGYPSSWDRLALTNLLRLVYRLSVMNEYRVVLGYADIAGVAAAAMGADAVASGWNYRQRQFVSERWVPRAGGQSPIPRVTSETLLSPLLGQGGMDAVARSTLAEQVLTEPQLRERMAGRADSWTNPQAVLQHMTVLAGLVRAIEAAGSLTARLDYLVATTTEATRLFVELRREGLQIEPVHATAVATLGAAATDARRAEGV